MIACNKSLIKFLIIKTFLFNLLINCLNFKVSEIIVISVEIIERYTNDSWISF